MSYKINHYNGTLISVVNDGTIDKTLDITLVGKNYAGYGAVQNENFTYLLENFASVTPPPKPVPGQLWYDSGSKKLKFYDGNKFRTGGTTEISPVEPTGLTIGDFWWDSVNNQLHAYTGNGFALIGPQVAAGSGATEMVATTVRDINNEAHTIIQAIVNGEVVFVISSDTTYTLDPSTNPIPGFSKIHQGVTMAYAPEYSDDGDIFDHRFWGKSRDSDRLGGFPANSFVRSGDATFNTTVNFSHGGFTVGNPNQILRVRNPDSQTPHIENIANDAIVFSTTTNDNDTFPLTLWRYNLLPGGLPSDTTPARLAGVTDISSYLNFSDNVNNIGASWARFNSVYASNFVGIATKSDTMLVNGSYLPASTTATNNTIVSRDSSGNVYANTFYGNSTNSTLAVTATKADSLKVGGDYRLASVNTSPNSVAVRDNNQDIWAAKFRGVATNADLADIATRAITADKSDLLKVGNDYRSSSTGVLPNTVAVRDADSNIYASKFYGTATNADLATNATNAVTAQRADSVKVAGDYRTASTSATANTVVVRDGNGDIYASTFHGNSSSSSIAAFATDAANLEVDGVYRAASLSALANTVAARDSAGAITATAFYGTVTGTAVGTNTFELVRGNMGANDQARILVGAAATDAGYLEIATADNGTEPIYVRQYTGVFGSIARTATLLDGSGNTSFPGSVTATGGFSGNASSATQLQNFNNPVTTATMNTIAYRDSNADLWARKFQGTATAAQYADLAEKYLTDQEYEIGTVMAVGGEKEMTACKWGDRAIGPISEKPAFMMNKDLDGGQYVALKGRVPVKVTGAVKKGQRLIAANDGTAMAAVPHANDVFAVALESNDDTGVKLVEALIL